ncbi:hypothetical protein VII00023_09059 [Vibrio ichthyoenteri ATCC 700023]|uniref:Uncharacterized protein n=1 Tax=Vibrio ichthyoenteri ATCC 700023 TaxID=870968 RepID=F9S8R1_9VIBR|nr:hypothetical protein [Vibrio ichthyoenteri]EGU29548.1 hypothetical protein VII00023_09059 [Vibrio ichthyoenteri ATCC 700023]
MSELTPQQDAALAAFKANLHLPHGGFYALIVELSKTYQLPFQTVRSVVMKAQRDIEGKIRREPDCLSDIDLSQAHWRYVIDTALLALAQENTQVMDDLASNPSYQKALKAMSESIDSEDKREEILEWLMQAYEKEVLKPLLAMLRTSPLYWKLMLAEELSQMTETCRAQFHEYPQHVEAAAHLFDLDEKVRAMSLVN